MDDRFRPCQVKLHKIGTDQDNDTILYEEHDPEYFIEIQLTKDKQYFVILSTSKTQNKIINFKREDLSAVNKQIFNTQSLAYI
jgi:oligopeptidase B